jgi:DNA-binding GntR family transcriptional regulator
LQAEGLIVNVVHRGPSVATITREDAREIYEVRRSLEALAAAGFAQHATDDQVRRLREDLQAIKSSGPVGAPHLLAAKNAFYTTLVSGCHNRVVGQVLTLLNNRVTALRRLSLTTAGRLSETVEELEKVVHAIEARKPELAGALCAAHIANAERSVLRHFSTPNVLPAESVNLGKVASDGSPNLPRKNASSLPTGETK